jgi:hypothetical protein
MGAVTAALLVAVVVVVALVLAGALRRRLVDERTSVRDYHQTLETLRHLSDQRRAAQQEPSPQGASSQEPSSQEPSSHRPAESPSAAQAALLATGAGTGRSRVPARPADPRRGARRRRSAAYVTRSAAPAVSVRVDAPPARAAPADRRAPGADAVRQLAAARSRFGPASTRPSTLSPGRGGRRRWLATAAAAVVIGAVTAVAVAEAPSRSPSSPARSSAASGTSGSPRRAGPAGARSGASSPASRPKTAPARAAPPTLDPVTASSTEATYQVRSAPYTVVVTAVSGPCWMEATSSATGQVLWEGTLQPGTSQSIPAGDGLVLRLGNSPAVTVTEGGQAVRLPTGAADVIDLTFEVA